MKPFRFLAIGNDVRDGRALAERARRVEQIGYHAMVGSDHLLEQLSPLVMMATVAAATERLRVGAFVLNNDLRHPVVLAQELASIDILSGGRVDVAIGAGWNRAEYQAIGLAFDPLPTRHARLAEAIAVLKGCFADGPFSFAGTHYRITDLDAEPKPVQRPHPPFLIGGGGRRTLGLAAREAAVVGLAPRITPGAVVDLPSVTRAATEEKIAWVRAAAGERFDSIELNIYSSMTPVSVTDHALAEGRALAADLARVTGVEIAPRDLLESPHIYIGTLTALADKITGLRRDLGITSFMLDGPDVDALVERLAGT